MKLVEEKRNVPFLEKYENRDQQIEESWIRILGFVISATAKDFTLILKVSKLHAPS
jgi:hypothetical protein